VFTTPFTNHFASASLRYDFLMASSSRKPWRIWSNVLLTVGGGGFMAVFLWSLVLIGYYSSKRPTGPAPERSWTEPLRWTHGHYGTHAENEQQLRLFDWEFPFFIVLTLGAAIRQLHEKNESWRTS
jgi:hypothetical protein